jgi:hypothetical protein
VNHTISGHRASGKRSKAWSRIHRAVTRRPWKVATRLRVLGFVVLILSYALVAGTTVWNWAACSEATGSCPSNGCTSGPYQTCHTAMQLFAETDEIGLPLVFLALGVILWSLYRDGRLRSATVF